LSHIFNKFKANNLVLETEYIVIEISINYAKCVGDSLKKVTSSFTQIECY